MVFATPVGQLTQILESNLGYSFIKVVARRSGTNAPLAEVKTKIAGFLRDENEDNGREGAYQEDRQRARRSSSRVRLGMLPIRHSPSN